MTPRALAPVAAALAFLCPCPHARGAGSLVGQGRFERIAGNPAMGHKHLYEWDLFVSPGGESPVGPSRRLGAPPGRRARGDGYFRIDGLPAGVYSLYVSQPDFFASPKVVPNVTVADGGETRVNVEPDIDYSTYFREKDEWTDWKPCWYQTFTARGTAARGVSFVLAGWGRYKGRRATVTVLRDTRNPDVREWEPVGRARDGTIVSDSDEWVRWPSGKVPLRPGKRYAVKLEADGGLAVYRRKKDDQSYRGGSAHGPDGQACDFDLNVTVFVDRGGQAVTHTRLAPGPGRLVARLHDTRWGQSFVATGDGLAAADLFAASREEDFALHWRVRQGGPSGEQVGPTKITRGAYFAPTTSLVGVSYGPGEVPLTPGKTYVIEATNPKGFTPYFQEPSNAYDDGRAYRRGKGGRADLAMTIVQYGVKPRR